MQIFKEEEMDRIYVLRQVKERKLTQSEAGRQLGLSERQIRRLLERMSEDIAGIRSRKRGDNRAFKEEFKQRILAIVREKYPDFGPTFASEKLRQWMMEDGLWHGRMRKNTKTHQSRQRRSRFGELVQIDGSHHDWFEGRCPKCCLLAFIDDATSELICARFEKAETTLGYMRCVYEHVQTYGIPVSYHSDRHSIFKTSRNDTTTQFADMQFNRALKNLGIELICAHSPQAKGRVERANKTLQDRLVKEMRLRKISSIEEANRYLPEFIKQHNKKFAVAAQSQGLLILCDQFYSPPMEPSTIKHHIRNRSVQFTG
ncbi:hypothetical protein FACS1894122_07190 [Alphaproteobacteria bacterium]|nr:hypothetical protein FACS1894122_07190 [Alphaproteobacteria bacterium]